MAPARTTDHRRPTHRCPGRARAVRRGCVLRHRDGGKRADDRWDRCRPTGRPRARKCSPSHLLPSAERTSPCSHFYGTALTNKTPHFASGASVLGWFERRRTEGAPDHRRPAGTVSQSGYPQAMWTTGQMLWRTRPNLCTTRWTAL
ncbi:hypothetical protein SAM23877_3745 [Streptomyces ambofaciens ATCC 23877]|uniref:Uncharacterized protein n=1 Tax=Streptomyces ambofaciens (strain ATCC 23877 / 3486 / DSM 40053 / JCM 4204 / NBRC 12836 / NRRL B-2516) TaxID=278992 RepID=A0A0K2AUH5_STRA7|nr:hypothetical protein SAM23877_3745 [Streptomyces ambofaciens ATCC 23877]